MLEINAGIGWISDHFISIAWLINERGSLEVVEVFEAAEPPCWEVDMARPL
jgi:hypothetical protein